DHPAEWAEVHQHQSGHMVRNGPERRRVYSDHADRNLRSTSTCIMSVLQSELLCTAGTRAAGHGDLAVPPRTGLLRQRSVTLSEFPHFRAAAGTAPVVRD